MTVSSGIFPDLPDQLASLLVLQKALRTQMDSLKETVMAGGKYLVQRKVRLLKTMEPLR